MLLSLLPNRSYGEGLPGVHRDQDGTKPRGHQRSSDKNEGHDSHRCHGTKDQSRAEDGRRLIHDGCYIYQGPHKSDGLLYRAESTATPDQKKPKYGEFIGIVRRNINSRLIVSVNTPEGKPEESEMQALIRAEQENSEKQRRVEQETTYRVFQQLRCGLGQWEYNLVEYTPAESDPDEYQSMSTRRNDTSQMSTNRWRTNRMGLWLRKPARKCRKHSAISVRECNSSCTIFSLRAFGGGWPLISHFPSGQHHVHSGDGRPLPWKHTRRDPQQENMAPVAIEESPMSSNVTLLEPASTTSFQDRRTSSLEGRRRLSPHPSQELCPEAREL